MKFDPQAGDWNALRLTFREAMDPQKWLTGGISAALTVAAIWLVFLWDKAMDGMPRIAWAIPIVVLWGSSQFSLCVVARLTALRLAHGGMPHLGKALAFASRHAHTLFLAPLPFLILGCLPLALVSILGLLGNIPVLGGILVGLFAMPSVLLSLLSVFVFLIWLTTTLFIPSIVAIEGSDVLDAAGKAVHLAFSSTWPLLKSLLLYLVFCVPFVVFVDVCIWGATWLGLHVLGRPAFIAFPGWEGSLADALSQKDSLIALLDWMTEVWEFSPTQGGSSLTAELRNFFLSVALGAIKAVALGMPLSFLGIGYTFSYTMCRFRTDGKSPREIVEDAEELIEGETFLSADGPKGG